MKDGYLDFDEYIRQGEPSQQEKAGYWQTAIGLQAVDGLKVSNYLLQLAKRNIEGELSMDEVDKLLNEYYEAKQKNKWKDFETYTIIDVHPDPEGSKMRRPI